MAIKSFYEATLNNVVNEKNQAIEKIKQKVTTEQIIPYNQKCDKELAEALKELNEKYTKKMQEIQAELAKEKQSLVDIANADKAEYANTVISTECETTRLFYDNEINFIKERIASIKE